MPEKACIIEPYRTKHDQVRIFMVFDFFSTFGYCLVLPMFPSWRFVKISTVKGKI